MRYTLEEVITYEEMTCIIFKGYVAPTFEELTQKEREFYFKKYAKFKIDDGIPVVGRKPNVPEPVLH